MIDMQKRRTGREIAYVVPRALRALLLAWVSLVLTACGESLSPPHDAERVRIVLYHPLPSGDAMKTVGDWAMLSTGELVQIQTNIWVAAVGLSRPALPVPPYLIEVDRRKWGEQSGRRVGNGTADALLDRKTGLLCTELDCRRLYAVCPPREAAMKSGLKCVTFKTD